jgi:hypothetical protein
LEEKMAFQKSEFTSPSKFQIIQEDQRVYFADFPDFPIFHKNIFPAEAWEQMDLDLDLVIEFMLSKDQDLDKLHSLLKDEFGSMSSIDDRSALLADREVANSKALDRFEVLSDRSFLIPEGQEDTIYNEAKDLHYFIKFVIGQQTPLDEFSSRTEDLVLKAIYSQGYEVDTCTGEIRKLPIANCVRGSPL